MKTFKFRSFVFVIVIVLCPSFVISLFERENRRVELKSNQIYPLASLPYRRDTSTRIVFIGQQGERLSLTCNIRYSQRNNRCSDDYFYVGYDMNPLIRGAEYYCGQRSIKKNARPTSSRPVLVIGKRFIQNHLRIEI